MCKGDLLLTDKFVKGVVVESLVLMTLNCEMLIGIEIWDIS